MNQHTFSAFFVFVIVVMAVAIFFRLRAGSKSRRAVGDIKDSASRLMSIERRALALNKIFRGVLNGSGSAEDRTSLFAYLKEYAELAGTYTSCREELISKLDNAYDSLEGLRMMQNITGGANDLGAIPYYVRACSYNELLRQSRSLLRCDPFDRELFVCACEYRKQYLPA